MEKNDYGIVALNNHVIVEIIETIEETTASGIILPTAISQRPQKYGRVISIGPEVEQNIHVGDILMFAKHGGQDVIVSNNKILKVLKIDEVYAVVSNM